MDPMTLMQVGGLGLGVAGGISQAVANQQQRKAQDDYRRWLDKNIGEFDYQGFDPSQYSDLIGGFQDQQGRQMQGLQNQMGFEGISGPLALEMQSRMAGAQDESFGDFSQSLERQARQNALQEYMANLAYADRRRPV